MVRGRMQHTDLAGNHLQHWHQTLLWAPVKKRGMTAWRQARWFPGSSMSMQVRVHVSCLSSCLPPAHNYSPSPWWLYCHLSTHSPVMRHQPALAPTPQPHHSPLQTHFPAQYLGVTPRTPSPPGQLCVPTAGYLPWQDFPSPFLRCLAETDPYLGLCCPSLWDIHGCCTTFAHDGEWSRVTQQPLPLVGEDFSSLPCV